MTESETVMVESNIKSTEKSGEKITMNLPWVKTFDQQRAFTR